MQTLKDIDNYIAEVEKGLQFEAKDGMKTCTVCFETKGINDFHKLNTKNSKDGLRSECKECRKQKRKTKDFFTEFNVKGYGVVHLKRFKSQKGDVSWFIEKEGGELVGKRCSVCVKVKIKCDYNKDKCGFGGTENACRKCRGQYSQKWYETKKSNPEFLRIKRQRDSNWRKQNPDKARVISRKYQQNNASLCKERRQKSYRKAYAENPAKFAAKQAKRKAMERNLPFDNKFGKTGYEGVLARFDGRCALTGDKVEGNSNHLDHVIPLSIGHGGTYVGNCIPLRGDLNLSKNDRNLFEWFYENKERFNLSQERFDDLILYLAIHNNMTPEEYRDFVYWCFDSKRTVEQAAQDKRLSSEIWKQRNQ
ncbi:HNH endonuclease [Halobacillus ihumii]|uniref:HNH endonuclease n=1 Tax=Halobacillus ihumii TaxID=2686092 RepID=UPI0013D8C10F|nr:HNH endonuclease signature motif containing protein [Halobacillus ihumii]